MKGRHNSVLSPIRNAQPEVLDIVSICHLANLCCVCAVKQLPVQVEELLIDVYFHFNHSAKRKEEYREFLEFCDVAPLKILKHASTRWLSLEKCVNRLLQQWSALLSYFESYDDRERPGRMKWCSDYLAIVEMKSYFMFLSFILEPLNAFNTIFQTDATQIAILIPEMNRLLRLFMAKFVLMRVIKSATDLTGLYSWMTTSSLLAWLCGPCWQTVMMTWLTAQERGFSRVCVTSTLPLSRRWWRSSHFTTQCWKISLCWIQTLSCATHGVQRWWGIWPLVSALWQMMKSNISWKSSRTINWVRMTICQLLRVTVVSTSSGLRWVARRHLWGQCGFPCLPCDDDAVSDYTATPTVNVCSQWSERSTRTRVRSSAMTPSVSCCPCYAFVPDKDLCKAAKVATWNYVREHQWRSVSVLGDMNVFLFWFLFCWSISCKLLSNNKIWYSLSWKVLCYLRPPDLGIIINPLFMYKSHIFQDPLIYV